MKVTARLLTAKEAAAYFKLPTAQFVRLRIGLVCFGAKVLYDKQALDAYLDYVSGLTAPAAARTQSEAEAALDRFTARQPNPSGRP